MSLRTLLIEKLGGYATVDDAIDAIPTKELKQRNQILTLAVKKLFNTIDADDILKAGAPGQWIFEGKILSKAQVQMLIAEAAQLEQTLLWKVLKKDILYQANRKMYLHAENDLHVVTAKFWLYTFDAFRTRMKSIAEASPTFNDK